MRCAASARRPLLAPPLLLTASRPLPPCAALGLVFLPSFIAFVLLDLLWITQVGYTVLDSRSAACCCLPACRSQAPTRVLKPSPSSRPTLVTQVGKSLYAGLKPILAPEPDAGAAALSWLCIVAGNYAFVLPRTGGGKPSWHVIGQVRRALLTAQLWLRGCAACAAVQAAAQAGGSLRLWQSSFA